MRELLDRLNIVSREDLRTALEKKCLNIEFHNVDKDRLPIAVRHVRFDDYHSYGSSDMLATVHQVRKLLDQQDPDSPFEIDPNTMELIQAAPQTCPEARGILLRNIVFVEPHNPMFCHLTYKDFGGGEQRMYICFSFDPKPPWRGRKGNPGYLFF